LLTLLIPSVPTENCNRRGIIQIMLTAHLFDPGSLFRLIPFDCLQVIINIVMKVYPCFSCHQFYDIYALTDLSRSRIRIAESQNIPLEDENVKCISCQLPKKNRK
jgi:hypothetical protein